MGYFTPKEPPFTIIGIYQEMMEWISSKLIGVVDVMFGMILARKLHNFS
jgi:hypothetical protein